MFKIFFTALTILIFLILTSFFVASKIYNADIDRQKDFVTDGCTLFPDASWESCCTEHDKAYWTGGSKIERLESDTKLGSCVAKKSGNSVLGVMVFAVVRVTGSPMLPVYWRWGFGWSYGRGYNKYNNL